MVQYLADFPVYLFCAPSKISPFLKVSIEQVNANRNVAKPWDSPLFRPAYAGRGSRPPK